ncbi:MAG: hypothetical protein KBD76_09435 [Bacteriovorax sp.]|nr:hypothetical protein [Bacteriovorax sp.]
MNRNLFSYSTNNELCFFQDGPEYYERFINLIQNAKTDIHLQTYIFMMDGFGNRVHAELIAAAQRNIKVYLLVDFIGSRLMDLKAQEQLLEAGIHFVRFNSIKIEWLYSWGRRLHHKILLVDQEIALIGGINVLSSLAANPHFPQLDFAVSIRGPVTYELTQYCQHLFNSNSTRQINFSPPKKTLPIQNGIPIKIVVNDWVFRRWQITKQYAELTKQATKEITIISSYFFPRKSFMKQLVAAKKRGVRVRLVLPKYSDWPSYIKASEYLYSYFLENEIEIYQWSKSILHGKLAIVDDNWVTIGSFNLNYTSYQQNLEMNVNIYSKEFTQDLQKRISHIINEGCERLDSKSFLENSKITLKIQRFLYYLLLSLIANFSIGLIYQEEKEAQNRFFNLLRIISALVLFGLGLFFLVIPLYPGIPFILLSFILIFFQKIYTSKAKV